MQRGIFVTGTDTNVGKTVLSAALMVRYRGEAPLKYWKPVQTGIEHDDDAREVARLAGMPAIHDQGVRLPHPVSPHLAARLAGTRITVRSLLEHINGGGDDTRWIVEGAGGVLVPLNERETMADLMCALDLPVLVAARSTLGTINHTLMTVEALRRRRLRVAGVVMVGDANDENRLAIETYGAAEVIAQMPRFDPLTPDALERWVHAEFDRSGVLFVGGLR
ncbi:MAG TPA: dethiobiotin synthase [Vicinamibacterales bacterium]|jgi:dethiobiotin synthase|nr:dethiobiotin synthase [Vicinamibacterales bacterium]